MLSPQWALSPIEKTVGVAPELIVQPAAGTTAPAAPHHNNNDSTTPDREHANLLPMVLFPPPLGVLTGPCWPTLPLRVPGFLLGPALRLALRLHDRPGLPCEVPRTRERRADAHRQRWWRRGDPMARFARTRSDRRGIGETTTDTRVIHIQLCIRVLPHQPIRRFKKHIRTRRIATQQTSSTKTRFGSSEPPAVNATAGGVPAVGDQIHMPFMPLVHILSQFASAVDRYIVECLRGQPNRTLEKHIRTIIGHRRVPTKPGASGPHDIRVARALLANGGVTHRRVAVIVVTTLTDRKTYQFPRLRVIAKHLRRPAAARIISRQYAMAREHQETTIRRHIHLRRRAFLDFFRRQRRGRGRQHRDERPTTSGIPRVTLKHIQVLSTIPRHRTLTVRPSTQHAPSDEIHMPPV